MNQQEDYLKKLHEHLLIIMDEIDRVCTTKDIRYYLAGGSLIGAIRHKGFIPWDDDMDINMPYDDFKRFVEIAPQVLGKNFYFRWITTEKNYPHDFAKVAMKGTLFQEHYTTDLEHSGIYVDIFPIYPSAGYRHIYDYKKKLVKFLHGCLFERGGKSKNRRLRDLPRLFMSHMLSSKLIYRLMLFVIHPKKEDIATHYACYPSLFPINRQICPKEWCGKGERLPFEDRMYICPIESLKKLKLEYGENVMELPPIEKRKMHYPDNVIFSDGQEILFSRCNKEVSYEDIID